MAFKGLLVVYIYDMIMFTFSFWKWKEVRLDMKFLCRFSLRKIFLNGTGTSCLCHFCHHHLIISGRKKTIWVFKVEIFLIITATFLHVKYGIKWAVVSDFLPYERASFTYVSLKHLPALSIETDFPMWNKMKFIVSLYKCAFIIWRNV